MNLSFYTVDPDYCDFLRTFDKCVPCVGQNKENRPFIGILIEVNGSKYYAPLSSPKPKHIKMKNSIDFIKINGGLFGAINLNNMIPIVDTYLEKVDTKILSSDTVNAVTYKNLLIDQLSWCDKNKVSLLTKAEKLYSLVEQNRVPSQVLDRCCNFKLLEQKCIEYHPEKNTNINYSKPSLQQKLAEKKQIVTQREPREPSAPKINKSHSTER